ncbi:MAG: MFS transporter [Planctomycetes bacterium]|nr:MFS transporter [Planctomycetota bacterium]
MSGVRLRNELYPLGFLGIILLDTLFKQWVVYFYAPPDARLAPGGTASALGSAKGIGVFLLIGFLLQALASPWVGQISDRLRTPFGRRRPVILLSLPVLALSFIATWQGWAPSWIAVPAYCLAFTLVAGPYLTLLPSLATTEKTRIRMSLTGAILALVGLGCALMGGPRLIERYGYGALAWVGLAGLGLTLLPATLLLKEAEPEGEPAPGGLAGYARELKEVAAVPGLLRFLIANGLLQGGFAALVIAAPYITEALLREPAAETERLNSGLFVGMLVTIPLIAVTAHRLRSGGQIRTAAATGALTLLVLGGLSVLGASETPAPLRWAVGFFLLGLPAMAGMALPPVILAAFADADAKDRQGAVFGLNGAAINLGNGLAAIGTTAFLDLGKTAAEPTGVRGVVLGVGLAFLLAAIVFPATPAPPPEPEGKPEPDPTSAPPPLSGSSRS